MMARVYRTDLIQACLGLGMRIIRSLVKQIGGELRFGRSDNHQGARLSVLFSDRSQFGGRSSVDACPAHDPRKDSRTMSRSVLYLVIGALVIVVAVFGYQLYQDRQKTTGIQINVGKSGISIEKK